jgi:hypothetical protein
MTCRNARNDIKTEDRKQLREEPGRYLLTAQAVSGMKGARAWLRLWSGTWEPVAPNAAAMDRHGPGWSSKGEPQAEETARGRVPRRGTGADRPVVATRPGNAGGAKGAGHPGSFVSQPQLCGRSW